MRDPLLEALDESLAGAKKQAALAVYPEASEREAGSRLARILAGELNLPPALLQVALEGSNPGPLREYLAALGQQDPTRVREKALVLLEHVAEELRAIRVHLEGATELERRMVRLRPPREKELRRAG